MNQSQQAKGPVITVRDLCKVYKVHEREQGVRAALQSLVRRKLRQVSAVDSITFDLGPGEVVGFLGPNGAGKTTTIKMLAGLLYPSSGDVRVLGYDPFKRDKDFLRRITLIMGQRHQLQWDIPAIESFEFFRAIYSIDHAEYKRILSDLVDLLDLSALLHKPVRNLSLGERMKCELAGALLHTPRVLFLDEPTIGLDVVAQSRLRSFIAAYNRRHEATVLLTSHYVQDVEALCRRVIFIHQGKLLFDGDLTSLVDRFLPHKKIVIALDDNTIDLGAYGEVVSREDGQITLRVPKADTAAVTSRLLANVPIKDLTVSDPPIADVIQHIFANEDAFVEEVA